jgi:hypothetical protein
VAADGEIDVLDPAGYGTLTITHGISIQGHGFASISQPNGSPAAGITVSAGASDTVLLNGLLIDGAGTGNRGILINSAGSVQIVDCVIRHFTHDAIDYEATAILSVSNTITSDGVVEAAAGINISPPYGDQQRGRRERDRRPGHGVEQQCDR